MNCEKAAEFVSALCDGEKIPRTAAEHVGACEVCGTRLKEYVEMGAELRRVASLEAPEEVREPAWDGRQPVRANWWSKGLETMRIPRLAVALLLTAVLVMGSGLLMVKVRAHAQGPILMLNVKPEAGQSMLCALSTQDDRSANCDAVLSVKGGLLIDGFRVISKNGDRVELGVKARFTPFVVGQSGTISASIDEIRDLPESTYWFAVGEMLTINVEGCGPISVTGEWADHMPAIVAGIDKLDPDPNELRVISPLLIRDKKVVFDFEGFIGRATKKDQAVFMYTPGAGRYILSLLPLKGAVQGHVNQSRASFEMNGVSYTFSMAAPIARSEKIWILYQPTFRPSQETPGVRDDQSLAGMTEVSSLAPNTKSE